MKVLVVGGSGLIGGDAALYLHSQGHNVTIMARKKPVAPSLAALDFLAGDYIHDDFSQGQLQGFDWLVFSAAADIRNLPYDGSVTAEDFYRAANDEAVPRFFKWSRDAGIQSAVYIGTFYPQVAPEKIGECPYVTSRHHTDERVRALSTDSFRVCSLNAPFVLGYIEGLEVPHLAAMVQYVKGNIPELPLFSPRGGTNHISSKAIAVAVLNALKRGESGKAYLIGDENISWKEYLEMWCAAAGNPCELEVKDDDHPMLPNAIMFAGAGVTVSYEIDDNTQSVLDYPRQQIRTLISEVVAANS
ncbi:NAD(P)-dependent oxidoreductase [Oceanicoccus sp. KOV_DT_Chl]|uniref:NAD-dependent epimerase/dehydratase family protein n=1 Tax=Oceanicoccus sp. KOV_DT_Chl TaxID=1904639 RepID=UPI000C7AC837|nr:NAD-dependent epimerase/dehydratase family protein [Oceanicoccus sp. KOV_DT_Chl]